MTLSDLLILALACYVVTDVLVNRAAPFGVMDWIRARWNTQLLRCMYCAGLWTGILVYVITYREINLINSAAVTGAMLILWRWTGGQHG
jgi:hypothetical protein